MFFTICLAHHLKTARQVTWVESSNQSFKGLLPLCVKKAFEALSHQIKASKDSSCCVLGSDLRCSMTVAWWNWDRAAGGVGHSTLFP